MPEQSLTIVQQQLVAFDNKPLRFLYFEINVTFYVLPNDVLKVVTKISYRSFEIRLQLRRVVRTKDI